MCSHSLAGCTNALARPLALLAFVVVAANAATAAAVQGNTAAVVPPMTLATPVQEAIRERVTGISGSERIAVTLPLPAALPEQQGITPKPPVAKLSARNALARFYTARTFRPAWSGADASSRLQQLLQAIDEAGRHGLPPARYHQAFLQQALALLPADLSETKLAPGLRADLDIAASDAFLTLAGHYMSGQVRPQSFDPEWTIHAVPGDPVPVLQEAERTGDLRRALAATMPQKPGYQALRTALERLTALAEEGPWPVVPDGPSLKPGMYDIRVPVLRDRLIASGDMAAVTPPPAMSPMPPGRVAVEPAEDWESGPGIVAAAGPVEPAVIDFPALAEAYEGDLVAGLLHFQRRHGLEPDGVVGPKTLAALNVSLADRIRQVELNLERWRWLPADLGRRYVLVNIAGQDYRLIEDGVERLYGRTIVGQAYRSTPVFSDEIEYLVFNPKWTVPRRLAIEDKLPKIKEDPDFLRREGFTVYTGWGEDAVEIQPEYIDWHGLSKNNFPFRLVQAPGDLNALGRVKFLFPNKYDVYLHDTPSRHLFERATRTFSSGCIRVEHPLSLAEHLLSTERGWDRARIEGALERDTERWIRLSEPVPVHLLHWTAWLDPDGTLQFRDDLYGRDALLDDALAPDALAHVAR
ncbi:MAG: L,D-transpeptidase family protein [Sneathiellaceae bacterium]